jgi:hypothetical protein
LVDWVDGAHPRGDARAVSLIEALAQVADPRKARGRIHDLGPILSLAVLAILAGRSTLHGIAQFGRDHGRALAHALGFRRAKTPCAATYSRVFRRIDADALERVLRDRILQRCPTWVGIWLSTASP